MIKIITHQVILEVPRDVYNYIDSINGLLSADWETAKQFLQEISLDGIVARYIEAYGNNETFKPFLDGTKSQILQLREEMIDQLEE